jgi:hypothetical protein
MLVVGNIGKNRPLGNFIRHFEVLQSYTEEDENLNCCVFYTHSHVLMLDGGTEGEDFGYSDRDLPPTCSSPYWLKLQIAFCSDSYC